MSKIDSSTTDINFAAFNELTYHDMLETNKTFDSFLLSEANYNCATTINCIFTILMLYRDVKPDIVDQMLHKLKQTYPNFESYGPHA